MRMIVRLIHLRTPILAFGSLIVVALLSSQSFAQNGLSVERIYSRDIPFPGDPDHVHEHISFTPINDRGEAVFVTREGGLYSASGNLHFWKWSSDTGMQLLIDSTQTMSSRSFPAGTTLHSDFADSSSFFNWDRYYQPDYQINNLGDVLIYSRLKGPGILQGSGQCPDFSFLGTVPICRRDLGFVFIRGVDGQIIPLLRSFAPTPESTLPNPDERITNLNYQNYSEQDRSIMLLRDRSLVHLWAGTTRTGLPPLDESGAIYRFDGENLSLRRMLDHGATIYRIVYPSPTVQQQVLKLDSLSPDGNTFVSEQFRNSLFFGGPFSLFSSNAGALLLTMHNADLRILGPLSSNGQPQWSTLQVTSFRANAANSNREIVAHYQVYAPDRTGLVRMTHPIAPGSPSYVEAQSIVSSGDPLTNDPANGTLNLAGFAGGATIDETGRIFFASGVSYPSAVGPFEGVGIFAFWNGVRRNIASSSIPLPGVDPNLRIGSMCVEPGPFSMYQLKGWQAKTNSQGSIAFVAPLVHVDAPYTQVGDVLGLWSQGQLHVIATSGMNLPGHPDKTIASLTGVTRQARLASPGRYRFQYFLMNEHDEIVLVPQIAGENALRYILFLDRSRNLHTIDVSAAPFSSYVGSSAELVAPLQADELNNRSELMLSLTDNGYRSLFKLTLHSADSPCPADFNEDGTKTVQDLFDFLSLWFIQDPSTDFDGLPGITLQNLLDYLDAWFAGCP